jgi:penicillin-binding protein 1A
MDVATRTAARKAALTKRAKPRWWRWTKRVLLVGGTLFFIGSSVFGLMLYQAYQVAEAKITNLDELMLAVERPPTQIFSADGKLLYEVSAEYRKPVRYDAIPENVRNAVLAAEDKRFFDHPGVDAIALGRILFTNVKEQRVAQGGSTLTMQLAKLLYTNSERSLKRKVGDMAMALAIEKKLTKEEILELYMNKVFFGAGAHGIKAAADVYFDKPLDKLTIGEAALLARCVRRPSDQNPYRNLEKAMENRNIVLKIMRDEGMISPEEYAKAKAEKYKFRKHTEGVSERFIRARYFVWHVLETFKRDFPDVSLSSGGYKIYTTLDTTMQSVAEAAVRETVAKHRRSGVTTAAFVAMDRDGRVLCEVGGIDFDKNQFNVVTDGYRQPGSAFKPFVYSAAFATGAISVNDYLSNERFVWPMPGAEPWIPKNSGGRYGGTVSVQTAFKMSMNVPMVRVMEKVGPNTALAFARTNFGFKSPHLEAVPALCLGSGEVTPLEMAQAYSTFMLRGNRVKPYCISRVVAPDGNILKLYQPEVTVNALDQHVADDIDALMRAVITSGTGTRAGIVPNARGKTGTTSDNKDAWFCGYADGVVGVGWIANEVARKGTSPIYKPMASRIYGGTVTVEFWAKVMKYAQKRFGKQMERPSTSSILSGGQSNTNSEPQDQDPDPDDFPPMDNVPPVEPDPPAKLPDQLPGRPTETTTGSTTGTTGDPPGTRGTEDRNPPPKTDPRRRPPVEPPRDEGVAEAEICADTGMRASIYCPETVTRRFARGQEPKRRCSLHGGERR